MSAKRQRRIKVKKFFVPQEVGLRITTDNLTAPEFKKLVEELCRISKITNKIAN